MPRFRVTTVKDGTLKQEMIPAEIWVMDNGLLFLKNDSGAVVRLYGIGGWCACELEKSGQEHEVTNEGERIAPEPPQPRRCERIDGELRDIAPWRLERWEFLDVTVHGDPPDVRVYIQGKARHEHP